VVYRDLNFTPSAASGSCSSGPTARESRRSSRSSPGVDPDPGRARASSAATSSAGYFAQNRLDNLHAGATVFENVMELRTTRTS
jgi:hypothetical protein